MYIREYNNTTSNALAMERVLRAATARRIILILLIMYGQCRRCGNRRSGDDDEHRNGKKIIHAKLCTFQM